MLNYFYCSLTQFSLHSRFWLVQVPITFIALGAWNSEKFDVLSGVFLGITIASIPANLSSMVRRFHDAGLSTKQCLKKLSYAVAPFLFAVNLMTILR